MAAQGGILNTILYYVQIIQLVVSILWPIALTALIFLAWKDFHAFVGKK